MQTIEVKLQLPLQLALDLGHLADAEAISVSQWITKYLGRRIDPDSGLLKEDSRLTKD